MGPNVNHIGSVAGIIKCLASIGVPDVQCWLRISERTTEPVEHHLVVAVFIAQYRECVRTEDVRQLVVVHAVAEIVLCESGNTLRGTLVVIGALS